MDLGWIGSGADEGLIPGSVDTGLLPTGMQVSAVVGSDDIVLLTQTVYSDPANRVSEVENLLVQLDRSSGSAHPMMTAADCEIRSIRTDGNLLWLSVDSTFIMLDATSLELLWSLDLGTEWPQMTDDGDRLVYSPKDHPLNDPPTVLVAIDKVTGDVEIVADVGADIRGVSAGGGALFVGVGPGQLVKLSQEDPVSIPLDDGEELLGYDEGPVLYSEGRVRFLDTSLRERNVIVLDGSNHHDHLVGISVGELGTWTRSRDVDDYQLVGAPGRAAVDTQVNPATQTMQRLDPATGAVTVVLHHPAFLQHLSNTPGWAYAPPPLQSARTGFWYVSPSLPALEASKATLDPAGHRQQADGPAEIHGRHLYWLPVPSG